MSRTLGDPRIDDSMEEVLGQRVSRSTDAERIAEAFNQFTIKSPAETFSFGEEVDSTRRAKRIDYTHFSGTHEGTTVVVYRTPGCGWEASVAERELMREKKQQQQQQQSSTEGKVDILDYNKTYSTTLKTVRGRRKMLLQH
jgi:hypothetical protein